MADLIRARSKARKREFLIDARLVAKYPDDYVPVKAKKAAPVKAAANKPAEQTAE